MRPTRATSAPAWRRSMARRRSWRVARGTAIATTALLAALVGHAAAGGAVPVEALLVLAPLVVAAGVALADRELRAPVLLALVLGVQVVVHLAASLAPGHEHGGHAAAGAVPSAAMLAGHLVAAVALALLLRGGEVLLWRLVALLLAVLGAVRAVSPAPGRRPGLRTSPVVSVSPLAALLDVVVRRGPPVPVTG